jgi:hypothetical protein
MKPIPRRMRSGSGQYDWTFRAISTPPCGASAAQLP